MPQAKKPVMDVASPGKTKANPTSRPLITSRGPVVRDPMVHDDVTDDAVPDKKPSLPGVSHKVIAPITIDAKQQPDDPKSEEAKNPPETLPDKVPQEVEAADDVEDTTVLKQSDEKNEAELIQEAAFRQSELVDKLVSERRYFLDVRGYHGSSGKMLSTLLGIILFVLVAGVLAIDAGLILPDVTLPFNLIP